VRQGILIPVYRHAKTAGPLIKQLSALGLPIIAVDDGNDRENRECLQKWIANTPGVILVSLSKNMGKGGAASKGFEKAAELGLTHVLQIDADGQHDSGKTAFFLEESAKYPDMLVCGYPVFDESAPKGRVAGRKVSNFWAAVVTLSTEIKDALCGFRVYPVDLSLRITQGLFFDKRMGFDPEILVRLYWKGILPLFYPVKVTYPPDGISNFRSVRDSIHISWVFSRLFIGMAARLPLLIARKIKNRKARS